MFNYAKFKEVSGMSAFIPRVGKCNLCGLTILADGFRKLVGLTLDGKTFLWIHKDFRK